MISVRVEIGPEASGVITLSASAIAPVGASDGLSAQVSGKDLRVQVEGSQAAINSLTAEGLAARVSAAGLAAGTYTVDVTFSPPSGVIVTGEYKMTLTLTRESQPASSAQEFRQSTESSTARTGAEDGTDAPGN